MEHFEKSIIPVIESVYPSFTPLERTVADFFIHNTDESDLSARHVSELLYVSEASLSRFAKKCGYTGYREFVYRYQEGLNATLPGTDDHIKQVLNTYQELLNKSYSLADRAQIDRICHILTSKRRVYVYGLGSSGLSAQEMKLRFMLAGVDIEAITDIHIMKMNAVLLNESCAAIGITVSGQTPEVLRALGAAKEKGASTILFTSRSSSDYDAFCDEVLLLAVKEHLKNGGAISPQFPILVMIDVLYSHFLTTDSERKEALYEYASMKRDPGRGSAYLSFLKKRCRDFFFFCLLLGVYVAFITLTGIGCPIRFSTGISCPGCGMSRAVLLMLSGHFRAAFRMHPLVYVVLPAGIWLFFGPEQTAGLRRFKKGIITVLVVLLLAVYAWRIYYHDPLLSIDPSLGRVLQWFYLN